MNLEEWTEDIGAKSKKAVSRSYVCTMINPKTHQLFDVNHDESDVRVSLPTDVYGEEDQKVHDVAGGYLDRDEESYSDGGEFVRANSLPGAVTAGQAYGFMLYSGMAVVAHTYDNAGVFSIPGGRSESAEAFWEVLIESDYASTTCSDHGERTLTIELPISESEVEEALESHGDYQDEEEGGCNMEIQDGGVPEEVDIDVTVDEKRTENTITAWTVFQSGLVLTWDPDNRRVDSLADDWQAPSLGVLYEIDLSSCYDVDIIKQLVQTIYVKAGEDIDRSKLLRMLRTMPEEFLDNSELTGVGIETIDNLFREAAGQRRFDYSEMIANKGHSAEWREQFGDLIDI